MEKMLRNLPICEDPSPRLKQKRAVIKLLGSLILIGIVAAKRMIESQKNI